MTTPTAEAPAPAASRPRPARRALDDLGLPLDAGALDAFARTEPGWLTADRAAAWALYDSLPGEPNLLYTQYIDLRAAQLGSASLVGRTAAAPTDATLPDDADGLIEIASDGSIAVALSVAAKAGGVRLGSLAAGATEETLLAGPALMTDDKFAQLTRAFWSDGVLLDIPAGVVLHKPVIIRWVLGEADRALITRTRIRLASGAEAAVVEELVAADGTADATPTSPQAFFAGTTEVTLGTGSTLRIASLQELPANVVAVQHRVSEIGDDATLQWALAQLGGRLVRTRADNRLSGDRSKVEQVEIVFGADDQLFDLTSYTTHLGRDTTGDLLSKGALLDRARTYMKGLINIEKTAIGTDSFLGEFGMNLSKQARSVAIPSLEIDQPDCRRAAHSSSVGPIDETQSFYLESRGIPVDDARKFIVLGFLEPVVARVPLEAAQDRLRALLDAKWETGLATADAAA